MYLICTIKHLLRLRRQCHDSLLLLLFFLTIDHFIIVLVVHVIILVETEGKLVCIGKENVWKCVFNSSVGKSSQFMKSSQCGNQKTNTCTPQVLVVLWFLTYKVLEV